jgi:hypothetical protein
VYLETAAATRRWAGVLCVRSGVTGATLRLMFWEPLLAAALTISMLWLGDYHGKRANDRGD